MSRLLEPKTFETETTAPNAENKYKHWKTILQNYLDTSELAIPSLPAEPTPAQMNNVALIKRKRLFALQANISDDIFMMISDATTYTDAMQILDQAYIKPTSSVYNRHKLISCKQEPGQSVDNYMLELQRLSKSCQFNQVTAEEYRKEYIRDAFINGIQSTVIRQRLLEQIGDLSLEQAFTNARTLEQAHSQSIAYEDPSSINAMKESNSSDSDPSLAATSDKNMNPHLQSKPNFSKKISTLCYFCGNVKHDRSKCPARDSQCNYCQKKGHWERVSLAKHRQVASIGLFQPSLA